MKNTILALAGTFMLCAGTAHAAVTIQFQETGGDVVATASGTINTAGFVGLSGNNVSNGFVAGTGFSATFYCVIGVGVGTALDAYISAGWSNSTVCSTGSRIESDSDSGNYVGVYSSNTSDGIYVSPGYTSGDPISSTSTWAGETFASLGLQPGTYVYSWGAGADADTLTVVIGGAPPPPPPAPAPTVPVPATDPLGLFLLSALMLLGGLGVLLGRRD